MGCSISLKIINATPLIILPRTPKTHLDPNTFRSSGLPYGCLHLSNSCPLDVGALASQMPPLLPTAYFSSVLLSFAFDTNSKSPIHTYNNIPSLYINNSKFLNLYHRLYNHLLIFSTSKIFPIQLQSSS